MISFFKDGPFPASFINFVFSILLQLVDKTLPMLGFGPRISGVGSNCSTNWATTTAQLSIISLVQGNVASLVSDLSRLVPGVFGLTKHLKRHPGSVYEATFEHFSFGPNTFKPELLSKTLSVGTILTQLASLRKKNNSRAKVNNGTNSWTRIFKYLASIQWLFHTLTLVFTFNTKYFNLLARADNIWLCYRL